MPLLKHTEGAPLISAYCCWGGQRSGVEFIPMDRLKEEIRIIYNNPKVKHVLFTDANILLNKKRAVEIIQHIKDRAGIKRFIRKCA